MNELMSLIKDLPLIAKMGILVGVALLVSAVIVLIAFPITKRIAKRVHSFALERFSERTRGVVFGLLALGLSLSFWSGLSPTGGEAEQQMPAYFNGSFVLFRTGIYILVGVFIIKLVKIGGDTVRHYYAIDDINNLRERKILTQLQYIQRIVGIVVFFVILSLVLMQFESMRQLGSALLTSAGISGIIIGIAAQKSIANLLAGFQIAFTQPIRLDDALIVNGEYGWVEEITLTYVTMRLWDQRRLIVPLQKFIDDTFQNWTRKNAELIGTVLLYVDYTFPVDALREEVERYLKTQELWDERVVSVKVTENSDRAMTIRVLVSATNAGNTFDLRCNTREHCIKWIQENYRDCLPQSRVRGEVPMQMADAAKAADS